MGNAERAFFDFVEERGEDLLQSSFMKLELGIAESKEQVDMARLMLLLKELLRVSYYGNGAGIDDTSF